MNTFIIISFGLLVFLLLNFEKLKAWGEVRPPNSPPEKRATTEPSAKPEESTTPEVQASTVASQADTDEGASFVNKDCTRLEDFVINAQINTFDLKKLAALNAIDLQISEAWYPLVLRLLQDLERAGWNKKVSCIKEKYASLRFYTADRYDSDIAQIIERYRRESETVCETCGAPGEIRFHGSWDYVACRKHYVNNRSHLQLAAKGFEYNGKFYAWEGVKDASFEDRDPLGKYKFLKIELHRTKLETSGLADHLLHLSAQAKGFGKLINHLPPNLPSVDYAYAKHFENPSYCEICAYQAVYFGRCECCENDSWETHLAQWEHEQDTEEGRQHYLKRHQLYWAADEGEQHEAEAKTYPKNPNHQCLFTPEDLEAYRQEA